MTEQQGSSAAQARANLRNPIHFLALGFGSGLAPKAPGTFGTLAAIPVYLLLLPFGTWVYAALTTIFAVVGIYLCDRTAKDMNLHDAPSIVWDEIVGFLITMAFVPFALSNVIAGFILFRIFDIAKPFPIGWLDKRVHGGLGIMLDDIIAGVFAGIILQLLQPFLL